MLIINENEFYDKVEEIENTMVMTSRNTKALNDELNYRSVSSDDLDFVELFEMCNVPEPSYLIDDSARIDFNIIQLIPGLKMRFENDYLRVEDEKTYIELKHYELLEYKSYNDFEKDVLNQLKETYESENF